MKRERVERIINSRVYIPSYSCACVIARRNDGGTDLSREIPDSATSVREAGDHWLPSLFIASDPAEPPIRASADTEEAFC